MGQTRRAAELRETRLRRMYAALSAVGEAVVAAADEAQLLRTACAALHDCGGFQQVVVRTIDAAGTVLAPVASAGIALAELRTYGLHADADADPGHCARLREPVPRAFREARTQYVADYQRDASLRASWPLARAQRAASVLAVPLPQGDRVRGVLSVAAPEPRFFDDELTALVQRVAGIIASGFGRFAAEAERRVAQERLLERETRSRHLTALSSDWTWETDAQHRVVQVAPQSGPGAAAPLLEPGKTRWEMPRVQGLDNDWAEHRRVLAAREPFRDFPYCGRDAAGKLRWLSVSGDPMFDAQGQFTGYIGTSRDITARWLAEERAARLTRLYAALGAVHEAITRVQDEHRLAVAACDALHDLGGFGVVCVRALDTTGTRLAPLAVRGAPAARLSTYRLDGEARGGRRAAEPSMRAFREGCVQHVPDYLADPALRESWAEVRRHGVASALAVPLRCQGVICGVLTVYSGERHFFDEELVELVERVGAALSHAHDRRAADAERRAAQERLAASEERFRRLTALASDWYWECDRQWRLTELSETFRDRTGIDPASRLGRDAWPDDERAFDPGVHAKLAAALAARQPFVDIEFFREDFPDARRRWRAISGEPQYDAAGAFTGYCGTGREISAAREARAQLRLSEERFRRLSELSVDWIWECDEDMRLTYFSPSYFEWTGARAQDVLGRGLGAFEEVCGDAEARSRFRAAVPARRPFRGYEYARHDPDGVFRWRSLSGDPIFDDQGCFKGYQGTGRDVTARRVHEDELRRQANYDALTGLPNRTLLRDRLDHAIARAERAGHALSLLLLDLDGFKMVNDSFGHDTGDAVLRAAGERLLHCLRPEDTVARLGGDEFVVVVEEPGGDDRARDVATRVLAAMSRSVTVDGRELPLSVSIGVTVFPRDGASAELLLRNADAAMYQAKQAGGNALHFYTEALNARAARYVAVRAGLLHALERGEFVLHYQPIVACEDGRPVGAEALLRWRRDDGTLALPADFIDVAEDTGLIVPIGAWVLHAACAQARTWQESGAPALPVSVNVSARQFRRGDFAETVRTALAETQLSPALLTLELTESTMMSDPQGAAATLARIEALGIGVAIDDFGTGHSSLAYLRRFPVTALKIDRSFVRDVPGDAGNATIVRAVIELAHALGVRVVAEGVENDAQVTLLRALGCDWMQGYLLGRPVPVPTFETVLRADPAALSPEPGGAAQTSIRPV